MNKSVCHIYGAGEHYNIPAAAEAGDMIIAADGGAAYLKEYGIYPDLIIGDFDSLREPPETLPAHKLTVITLPAEKDNTDTAAAIEEGWSKGYRIFRIYGGTGGRPDHTLANIQCVADIALRGGRGYLFDRDYIITAVHNGKICFSSDSKGYLSAFSHSSLCTGVCETGLKYSLSNATLKNTVPLGVSNEFTGKEGSVSVKDGTLIVIYPTDAKEIRP